MVEKKELTGDSLKGIHFWLKMSVKFTILFCLKVATIAKTAWIRRMAATSAEVKIVMDFYCYNCRFCLIHYFQA